MNQRPIDTGPQSSYALTMQIELTPEQEALVQHLVEIGQYQNPAAAIHHAMDLWAERERARLELISAIEEGERSLEEDGGILLETEEDIRNFFNEIKDSGKARLAAAQKADLCA